ncbi:GPO family capsid scaffolding protein [Alkalimonas mucilaginosa]|uniref:GPO family capsid scaffolding protein n=1 Tax=Alkalimonas mucilaginosa TaxID=3057676 RepID=A0ABU7JD08_9GAMM|nr:GPO family capsid scaffolding protein [Alkalimonas sp. MEB004]MEE2023578.1 GPO family capsid scaffolding protein [Alkalimonas sp. MEB004]
MAKQTGWVIAATAGATIDGRVITEQWIKDMAEQYSTEEYTAMVWPEHFRSSWAPFDGKNWGTVDEVKAAKAGGKLRLYVKLTANDYLLQANKDGQKLFMSIEPNIDYKGTGKAYLTGIAVTDSPASTGTTRLKFSVGEQLHDHEVSQLEQLLFTDFINDKDQQTTATEKGLLAILQDFFTSKQPAPATEPPEDDTMNKEQFDALMGKIGGIESKVADLETKFSKAPDGDKPADPASDKPAVKDDDKPSDKPSETITAEQFSQLNESLGALVKKVDGLEQQFKDISKEVPGQEPDAAGTGDSFSVV